MLHESVAQIGALRRRKQHPRKRLSLDLGLKTNVAKLLQTEMFKDDAQFFRQTRELPGHCEFYTQQEAGLSITNRCANALNGRKCD